MLLDAVDSHLSVHFLRIPASICLGEKASPARSGLAGTDFAARRQSRILQCESCHPERAGIWVSGPASWLRPRFSSMRISSAFNSAATTMASASPGSRVAECSNIVLVLGCDDSRPGQIKLHSVSGQFVPHGRRDHDLRIEIAQKVKLVHSSQVEDWGRVGNDDQAPGSLLARSRSCSIASRP